MSSKGWQAYVDDHGDVELAKYIYNVIMELMKTSLDMGTLLSDDKAKLRAYKEQTKSTFKKQWLEIAEVFEALEIIEPCICTPPEYCTICGGARYRLSGVLTKDEIAAITSDTDRILKTVMTKSEAKATLHLDEDS